MKEELKNHLLGFIFDCSATAVGFFIALWVNTYLDNKKDFKAFETKQKMLLHEIQINEVTIDSSFVKYAATHPGFIFAELSTQISEDLIRDQHFIGETNDSLLTLIQTYHKHISLLNMSRNELNAIRKTRILGDENPYSVMEGKFIQSIVERRELLFDTFNEIKSNICRNTSD